MIQQTNIDDYQHRKRSLWPFFKRLFPYSLRYKKWMALLALASGLVALVDALIPLIWLRYIDHWITPMITAFQEGSREVLPGFFAYALVFLLLFILQAIAVAGFIRLGGLLREYVVADLREDMFRKLQYLSHGFYDKHSIGHLSIRLTSDVKKVSRVITNGLVDLLFGIIMIIVSLGIMLGYHWRLTLIVLFTIPVLLVLAVKIRTALLGYARKVRRTYSIMTAYLTEHLNGQIVNKVSVQEQRASKGYADLTETFRYAALRSDSYSALYGPLVVVTGSIAAALVIYFGGHLALQEKGVTVGLLAAFFSYARLIFEPIFDITRYYARAQDSLSAGERIFSLIDAPIEIKDKPGVPAFEQLTGDIRFEEVDFHYTEDKPILKNFSLHIPAGQSVALVGETGSGKSTIVSLIARFYEPVRGALRIDEIDYRERQLASYRKQLGMIQQTPHLFAGTLRENLQYGKLDANDEELKAALKAIGAGHFAHRLDEQVGEEGGNYSLGERQLISFARAMLKNPRILIMDEATASVDAKAETRLQQGALELIEGRTSIIIAHRLSTIRHCDRILLLDQGKIIEDGSHDALMAKQGAYFELYTQQMGVLQV